MMKKKCEKKSLNHPKKEIVRAPHTPKCLGAVVLVHHDRALSPHCDTHYNIHSITNSKDVTRQPTVENKEPPAGPRPPRGALTRDLRRGQGV